MSRRVQVQMDLQFEVIPQVPIDPMGDLSPIAALRYERMVQEAIIGEVQAVVAEILAGGGNPSQVTGYARIKGALEYRNVFGELRKHWLEEENGGKVAQQT